MVGTAHAFILEDVEEVDYVFDDEGGNKKVADDLSRAALVVDEGCAVI